MYGKIHLCSNHKEAEELSKTELYDEDTGKYDGLALYYIRKEKSWKVNGHGNEIEGTEYIDTSICQFKKQTFEESINAMLESSREVFTKAIKEALEKTLEEINNG